MQSLVRNGPGFTRMLLSSESRGYTWVSSGRDQMVETEFDVA